ncbi:hypothetical protein J1614_004371 [Plenodomus biglobosus]|nr:hypothetical protein J1614_004371 [Plenodomus biglobosus]
MADIPSSITPYMTLSYRWSLDPGLRLLSSTMHDFLVGSPIKNLPQTFQDLIIVARCFGIHYIWIDALCIIQDSIEDWELEALTMRLVYTNSYCNVAASASVDEHGGLFRSRNVETLRHIMVELPALGSGPQTYYLVDRDYCDKHIFDSHLHQRGWVFQERHLAPRVLHFGKSQVLWECFEDLRCEGFPNGVPNYWSQRTLDSLWSLKNRNDTSPKQSTEKGTFPDSVYFLWNRLVKSYSDCIFTKSSDKLLAFSGIAKIFQEVTGDDYLAGLWRSRLLDGLDWRVYDPWELTSSQYRAPSWSWASIDGPLRYDTICGRSVPLIEVTKIDIQPYKSDPTGSIISASLSLKGHLIKFECMHYEPGGNYTVRSGTKQLMTRLLLDTLYRSLRTGDSVYCLPLKTIPMVISSGFTTEVFLLLLEMTEKIDTFRRIGHFVMNQEDIQEYFDLQIGGFEIGPLCPRKLSTITIV